MLVMPAYYCKCLERNSLELRAWTRILCKCFIVLFCTQVDLFIHRLLIEEDAKNCPESNDELFRASADAGEKLYQRGDYAKSQISNLDVYLLKKVIKLYLIIG